ncbi:hypothetical protein PRZ48_014465 [Zasmidium cellare]|uniref:Transcription initiation factor TFIID subunit 10 n=1 Tax=Zasmidium cellare TaxID=395010 RepID=A0ABR0DYD6_ZASCE|nr:hypothetical protein PRZ48_014465 [Zasmidium cellare]
MADNNPTTATNNDSGASSSTLPNSNTQQSNTQQSATDDPGLDNQQERDLDAEINPAAPPSSGDITMESANEQPAAAPAAAPAPNTETNGLSNNIPLVVEPRIPQKKDTSLREFMGKMDDYAPLIPDAVTDYYLTLAGLPPPPETDRRLARLLALATQKFIADIAADAYQYSRIRSTNTTSNNPMTGLGGAAGFGTNMPGGEGESGGKGKKDQKAAPLGGPRAGYGGGGAGGGQGRTVLTMEDLGMAVGEYGVNVKRGEFYR